MESKIDIDGVRISPSSLEFRDIVAGCIYQTHINVHNSGRSSKRIRFHVPTTEKFQLLCKSPDKVLAPGLQVSAMIEFRCENEENYHSKLLVVVEDEPIEIPLAAMTAEPAMEITSNVEFGTVIADGKVQRQEIAILNRGSKNGAFKLVYKGSEPISIVPMQGVVKAGYSQPIRFEFNSKKPGNLHEIVNVSMEGQSATEIHVFAEMASRSLQLLSMEEEKPINHINFGPTFYGTDVLQSYILYNKSPETVSFVVILEEDGEGQEIGVDLSLVKSTALVENGSSLLKHDEDDLTSLVTAFPSQGTIRPFEKRPLYFKFSPRFSKPHQGWASTESPEPRKDYALFLHIDIVGNMSVPNGRDDSSNDSRVEVALTGTALPVLLSVLPSSMITFENCAVGSSLDCTVTVQNDSQDLAVEFSVSKCAHFVSFPQSVKLEPNGFTDLLISFRPNQIGHFTPKMDILVQGSIVEYNDESSGLPKVKQVCLCKYPLLIDGESLPVVGLKTSKSLTAQGKLFPEEPDIQGMEVVKADFGMTSLKVFKPEDKDCLTNGSRSLEVANTRDCKLANNAVSKTAKPDDLAMSVRPSNKKENITTQFTKTKRYTYVDPDYQYTADEERKRRQHNQKYADFLQKGKDKEDIKGKTLDSRNQRRPADVGRQPKRGSQSTRRASKEAGYKVRKDVAPENRLITSKKLDDIRQLASTTVVSEGLKALPTTEEETRDCTRKLAPLELYQVVLEPESIDFGEVCLKSLASKKLKIVNSLQCYVHFKTEVDCRELRQTSPLSQVIPPGSVAALEFIFESNVPGSFERSVSYTINGHHHCHLVITAEVVNVSLKLSSNYLSLSPSPGLPPESGMRESVTLHNKNNVHAHFSWTPVVGKDGTAFSVRPARGTVNANSNLVCEVVFYPSFYAPLIGSFSLNVDNGNSMDLHAEAMIAPASCSFVEHRVMFGAVPLNLVTRRSAFLKNTSQNHAYFKVNDVSPIPGMVISTSTGTVPVGGSAELRIDYKPFAIQKFDTQIEVVVRGWKSVFLRMGGHVEAPCVDISIDTFQFGGVYCGAESIMPFVLKNMARSRAKVQFDLTEQKDFSITFGERMEANQDIFESEGCYEAMLAGQQELQCYLKFNPTEIASYDFVISTMINQTTAPSPPPSPYPASVALSRPSQGTEDVRRYGKFPTPSRRVQATALRAPLQITNTEIGFHLPPGYYDMGIENAAGRTEGVMFVNNSNSPLTWYLDLDDAAQYIEDGVFQLVHRSGSRHKFVYNGEHLQFPAKTLSSGEMSSLGILFTPAEPGVYETVIPVILGDDTLSPYRLIHLRGELAAPTIHFEPKAVQFLPTPLRTITDVEVNVIAQGFRRAVTLQTEIPDVELENGCQMKVFDVDFPDGNVIETCCKDLGKSEKFVLPCRISFQSSKPTSVSTALRFFTENVSCDLPVIATADNCLMTSYKFLAVHQADFHIVCDGIASKEEKMGKEKNGQKVASFVPALSAIVSPTEKSNVTTSTSFGLHSSAYEESSFPSSTAKSQSTENKDGDDYDETTIPYEFYGTEDTADTDEERYIKDVTKSIQRWFSSQAWANGPSPMIVPNTLRSCFSTGLDDCDTTRAGIWSREKKKDNKTIFDIVTHFCGKAIPGIPINGSIPSAPIERTRYIYWMYTVLINFLRCQGAIVATLQPEYLLDKNDFRRFVSMRQEDLSKTGYLISYDSLEKELEKYEAFSKSTWTDLLLQIIKVFILNRVTPQHYRKINLPANYPALPPLNVDPFSSNVFSVGERIILSWFNHHFQQQKNSWLWKTSITGEAPSSRWIVNFDNDFLDGLVFASVLAAYAPFVVSRFLYSMYTHPTTAEQCLHNALKVVNSIRYLGMDYDVLATDVTEPNPVSMLLLCSFLFRRLPHYLPRSTIEFNACLHSTVTKKVKLQNPSSKPIVYQIIISGENSSDFRVPAGKAIKIPAKSHVNFEVEYKGRFLRACSAVLILVGKRAGFQVGSTIVFKLSASIDTIIPLTIYKKESPCYELKKIRVDIKNPFEKAATFKVILVEVKQQKQDQDGQVKEKTKAKSLKRIESKTDHGRQQKAQSKSREPVIEAGNITPISSQAANAGASVSVFWCSTKEIFVGTNEDAKLEIDFLPFSVGNFQCSILLINEDVGDIVYSIEAEARLPLPSIMPFQSSSHIVRVSSSEDSSEKQFGFDLRTVYWRCSINEEVAESILLPMVNEAKENALVIATQQRMSDKERWRREITGSLSAAAVSNAVKSMGLVEKMSTSPQSSNSKSHNISFAVEGNSKYFQLPSVFEMNLVTDKRTEISTAQLPVTFVPDGPGHYQCRIVLTAPADVRVFQIEVTVNPDGSDIELEFTSPTHEFVTQNIPVVNSSEHDWILKATVDGAGFYGPETLYCPRLTNASYQLKFQPLYEGFVKGCLKLTNTVGGTETIFMLSGEGRKPSQSDHFDLNCQVNEESTYEFMIPNETNRRMIFQAFCNLDFVSGAECLVVLPRQTATFSVSITPWKRGLFDGRIAFITDVTESAPMRRIAHSSSDGGYDNGNDGDDDSDDDDDALLPSKLDVSCGKYDLLPDFDPNKHVFEKPFRIWYSMRVASHPSPPINTLEVECACHCRAAIELLIENPTDRKIEYDVIVEGQDLITGEEVLSVHPKAAGIYQLDYAPAVVGKTRGSVIFQHPLVGEVWYDLLLVSIPPQPKDLKVMQCALGSKCVQMIRVDNPTDAIITYFVSCSNSRNFWLELDDQKIDVLPHSGAEVPLTFSPSALGLGSHQAQITFASKELGDFIFNVKGNGQAPTLSDDYVVRSSVSCSSSTIITFENPFEEDIVVNVDLSSKPTGRAESTHFMNSGSSLDQSLNILLRKTKEILLAPRSKFAIPVCFSPETMVKCEAICYVRAMKRDGSPFLTYGEKAAFPYGNEMRWGFPVVGIPEFSPLEGKKPPCIECKARKRAEEMLELSFTGVNVGAAGPTPQYEYPRFLSSKVFTKGSSLANLGPDYSFLPDDFKFEFEYADSESHNAISRSVGINLVQKKIQKISGVITLVFNVVFSPSKPLSHIVQLIVKSHHGGIWRFPIKFVASKPDPDDVIELKAAGLNKEVSVGFRLTSQSDSSVPFWVSMEPNGDQMFSVLPSSGELPSLSSPGQLFKVTYKPKYYGKIHSSKLVVHTSDFQWTYELRGRIPKYLPPSGFSSQERTRIKTSEIHGRMDQV